MATVNDVNKEPQGATPAGEAAGTAAGTGNSAREAAGTAAGPSARDRYRDRYREAYPDMNLDDDEAFYSQANNNLDELENYRESNRQLAEAFDKTPLLAGLVLAAKEGENPFTYLAENVGPDMDIRELANDPDFSKKMGDALKKFQDKQAAGEKAREEMGKNAIKSFATLKELQKERGLSDEECVKMANDFFGEIDDEGKPVGKESFMQLASKGVVTKGMWEALFNARSHDADVAAAGEKARATALNEKVQNGLRSFDNGMPPSMPTGGRSRGERKPKSNDGSLAAFKDSLGL